MKAQAGPSPASRNDCRIQRSQAKHFFIISIITAAAMVAAIPASAQNAGASPTDKQSNSLDEIIVRAEKQGRTVMDTATSVVVIDASALEQQSGTGTRDLLDLIPNITTSGTGNFAPAVRGIDGTGPAQGADAFLAGTRSRLNVQIDGRPATYNEITFGDVAIWDVQQMEILRGPQSALQGRDAIAGTIAVETKNPTFDTEGSARVVGSNYDGREYDAAFSAPIVSDQLAFRIAAQHSSSESFVSFTPFDGSNNPGEFSSTTVRSKLLYAPTSEFSTLLTLNYAETRAPQAEQITRPFDSDVSSTPQMPVFQPRTESGILATNWKLSDAATFTNTMSYTDLKVLRFAPAGTGNVDIDGNQIVEEPNVRFKALDGQLTGLGGLYFYYAHQHEYIDLIGGGTFADNTWTAAGYGEATYAFSPQFDLTVGARYEEETHERQGQLAFFLIDFDQVNRVFLPKAVLTWHPSSTISFGVDADRGYNGGGAGFTYFPPFAAYTYSPEYVWDYEGFVRASLADGRVALTANVFYSRYHDMQLPYQLSAESIVIRNADAAETHGAEISAVWRAVQNLQVFTSLGLLKTEITNDPGSGAEGNDLPRSPRLTADFGIRYSHPQGVEFSVDARYSDTYFSDVLDTPRAKVGPLWLANTQLGYQFPHTRVFGYVKNIFNSDSPILIAPGATPDADIANIQHPRTYGIGVQVDF
jgi:iron complex outermembrane recepter protein